MTRVMIYRGSYPFKYYLLEVFTGVPYEVSEDEFFNVVGFDRRIIPMHYDEDNINRQNFFLAGEIIGYRER